MYRLNISSKYLKLSFFSVLVLASITARAATIDRIVAVVDKYVILQSEVEELVQMMSSQGMLQGTEPAEAVAKMLPRLIDEKLLLVIAERDTNIVITPAEVEKMVDGQIKQLAQENGGMDRLSELVKQSTGYSFAEFRNKRKDQMREQAYKQRLQQRTVGQFEPSALQVKQFFTEYKDSLPILKDNYKIAHLEMAVTPSVSDEKKAKVFCDSLLGLLAKSASFDSLAAHFSDDPTGKSGGDLGYTKRGTLDPEYEKAAFSMDVGDYTKQPVRSSIGYHIIKVTAKKDLEVRTSHILRLLLPNAADTVRTLALLDSLSNKIKSGAKWDSIVSVYSRDKETSDHGGLLGWYTSGSMKTSYLQAVDTLAIKGVSAPILAEGQYHLFMLLDKKDERNLTIDEDWNQIYQLAKNHYITQKLKTLVDRWRGSIHIENRL